MTPQERDSEARYRYSTIGSTEYVRVGLLSYDPGPIEFGGAAFVGISIHVGRTVRLGCRRGDEWHRGSAIHGDVAITPPSWPGAWEMHGAGTGLIVCLGLPLVHNVIEECGGDPSCVEIRNRFHGRDLRVEHIGWALKAELDEGCPSGRLYLDSLAAALAVAVVQAHSSMTAPPVELGGTLSQKQLHEVLTFMDDHLDEDLHLNALAAVSGLGISRFKAGFRAATGVSAYQYLIRRRVEHAARLLQTSTLPISQVALASGFCHQSHLALHMRRLLGASPSQMQRAARP